MVMRPRTAKIDDLGVDSVVEWRRRRLRLAGFDAGLADAIAADARFDLHALLELLDAGCPPHLAARILAPLDDRGIPPR